jgi:hypothetical protein
MSEKNDGLGATKDEVIMDLREQVVEAMKSYENAKAQAQRYCDKLRAAESRAALYEKVVEAAETAQCDCSISQRDSGHAVGCWMPALTEALSALPVADKPVMSTYPNSADIRITEPKGEEKAKHSRCCGAPETPAGLCQRCEYSFEACQADRCAKPAPEKCAECDGTGYAAEAWDEVSDQPCRTCRKPGEAA